MNAVAAPTQTLTSPDRLEVMGTIIEISRSDESRLTFDMEAAPGLGVPMHVHEHEDELFLVRRGQVKFVLGDREIIARPGDTVFGPRGIPHSWEAVGDETIDAIVTILPGTLEGMFRELGALPAGAPDLERIGEICGRYGVRFA